MASSSSAVGSSDQFDVFLSFRGTDTRNNFTSHLYHALCQAQVKAFIDNNLPRGEGITPGLEKVIECSKISIIIFSPDYASSAFCLDEMVKIMECKESREQTVLPIFYKVYPSTETYEDAFSRHTETIKKTKGKKRKPSFWKALNFASEGKVFQRHEDETIKPEMKVEIWKSVFCEALNLAGWHIDDNSVEAEIIGGITREVLMILSAKPCWQSKGELRSTSLVGETANANLEKIWECLMNDETSRVGVYGMGGIGKTTIASHINNRSLGVASSITRVYWVTVSKDSSIYKLQTDIAKIINLDLSKEDDELKRAVRLQKELEKTQKFVLILDDVWESFEVEDVGIPLLVGGGKLLLTTRNLQVCKRMECKPIKLEHLSEKEAWDLFMKESKFQINDSLDWREIVESVIKECAGLPLAIIIIARRMRGVLEISEWRDILRELRKPYKGHNHEMEKKVFKSLKVSYDHLPDNKHRQCFLYCSLFPKDYEVKRNDLIEYWICEGLMDELGSREAELDKGNAIINELIGASLLEQGYLEEQFVKMHDVVRDMSLVILREIESSLNPESVSIMNNTMLKRCISNVALDNSELKTLLLRGTYTLRELPSCFFAGLQNLTVLDMRYQAKLKSLPDSITELGNLRVLFLTGCVLLEYIPCLAGLENLKHLDLSHTGIKEIPRGMERLVNIRVLKLSYNRSLYGLLLSAVLQKLSNLQCLELEQSYVEAETNGLISLVKLEVLRVNFYDWHSLNSYLRSGHWQRLAEYHIYCVERSGRYLRSQMFTKMRKAMSVDLIRPEEETHMFCPHDIQQLELVNWRTRLVNYLRNTIFPNIQILEITAYKGEKLFSPSMAQQFLYNVKELTIRRAEYRGVQRLTEVIATEFEFINRSDGIDPTIELPKLKSLMLEYLPDLWSIYTGQMVCPSLESITIRECPKLESLPFCTQDDINEENPQMMPPSIELEVTGVSRRLWDSIKSECSEAKSRYQLKLGYCYT